MYNIKGAVGFALLNDARYVNLAGAYAELAAEFSKHMSKIMTYLARSFRY